MRTSLLLVLIFFFVGCANDDDELVPATANPPVVSGDGQYFRLKVNGHELPFELDEPYGVNNVALYRYGTEFYLRVRTQPGNNLNIDFDENGKIIKARYVPDWISGVAVDYFNYPNFPGNYFNLEVISHDKENHRIKVALSGKLYLNETNLNSETFDIDACEFDLAYPEQNAGIVPEIFNSGFLDNCSAKFNGTAWYATREHYGSFTTDDPYRLEVKLSANTSPGSFAFTPGSSTNCIKFSKFNTTTLAYDTYDTTGSVAYTFKEFHGATSYTYMGSFSFTAVNQVNPADIIQVTDGIYTCYLQ